jgi:signal transduction histidine kinase
LAQAIDFTDIFVRSPGDLLFFLAVILMIEAGVFMALERRLRAPGDRGAERYLLAGIGATIVWALLMVGAVFALLTGQNSSVILPPLERVAQVVTILVFGWAFLTAGNEQQWNRAANVVLLVGLALLIVGYIITGVQWPDIASQTDFNLSIFGVAWTLIPALIALVGIVLMVMYFRLVPDAPLKLVFFVVLLVGYGGTLLQIAQGSIIGDASGVSRLAFLAALPVVPAVIYRMVVSHLTIERLSASQPIVPRTGDDSTPTSMPTVPTVMTPVERESAQLLRALGLILEQPSPAHIPQHVVLTALEILKADVGMLLTLPDANYADVVYAFDAIRQQPISAMSLNLDDQPTLVNAIERRAQRPLFPDRNGEELQDLYTRLDIGQMGPAYFQPLTKDDDLVAVLVVALPYSARELTGPECERLKGIALISGGLLALSFEANEAQRKAEERAIEAMIQGVSLDEVADDDVIAARQEMQASLEAARQQISALTQQVTQLKIELDYERSRLTEVLGDTQEGLSVSQRIVALHDEQKALQEERELLISRLREAETALIGATGGDVDVYNTMVELLQRERDDLVAQREQLQAQLAAMRSSGQEMMPESFQQMLARMTEDKAHLEVERDRLNSKLHDLEAQLSVLGIENGPSGLAQLVGQLHEQRAALQAKYDALKSERDTLLRERARLEATIEREQERDKQIEDLQQEVAHLAADREAALKQREKLRAEREEFTAKLDAIKEHRARLLAETEGYRLELEEAHEEQARLRDKLQQLSDERSDYMMAIDRLHAERQKLVNERDQLLARVEGDRDRLQQLGTDGVSSLTGMIEELTEQRNQLERELNQVRTALAASEDRIEMLQVQAAARDPQAVAKLEDPALILGMVQELRTPMTSIVGYVDLLLSESAGILGEMQRKFLNRVQTNVARLATMLDDLTRITALDTGQFMLVAQPVDVVGLIEDAITNSASQFREKGLAVHLDLNDDIPMVAADQDAMGQIIGQLLTNAYLASPPNTEVVIMARRQHMALNGSNDETDMLFVSVEDRGGGIALEDQARVFSRKYKAENPLIQGLGDTGVGLSIAKALVEAHGGRLWLETLDGIGSRFNFVLPLETTLEVEG